MQAHVTLNIVIINTIEVLLLLQELSPQIVFFTKLQTNDNPFSLQNSST